MGSGSSLVGVVVVVGVVGGGGRGGRIRRTFGMFCRSDASLLLLRARSASHHQTTLPSVRSVGLPVMFSSLGIIPCNGADKQSSSCGVT